MRLAQLATAVTVITKVPRKGTTVSLPRFESKWSTISLGFHWGISRRSFIHGSHLVVREQSGLAASAASRSNMSRAVGISQSINVTVILDVTMVVSRVLAFAHVRPGLTVHILRVMVESDNGEQSQDAWIVQEEASRGAQRARRIEL